MPKVNDSIESKLSKVVMASGTLQTSCSFIVSQCMCTFNSRWVANDSSRGVPMSMKPQLNLCHSTSNTAGDG